jgi:hypothetical protein
MKLKTATLLAAVALGSPALAQGTAEQRAACTPDVFRLCSSDIPNVPAIVACLQREKANLSNPCRLVMAAAPTTSATRSVKFRYDLCHFNRELTSVDEVWRTWCRDLSWTD